MEELIKIKAGINEIVLSHRNECWFFEKDNKIDSTLASLIYNFRYIY